MLLNQVPLLNEKPYSPRITLLVNDDDEAIDHYTEKLDFERFAETFRGDSNRWLLLAQKGWHECCNLLAEAVNDKEEGGVTNQAGGAVSLPLYSGDFLASLSLNDGTGRKAHRAGIR
jgi:hypothetical protein